MIPLESYFQKFRENTIGVDAEIETPFGKKKLLYADWIASGRLYRPIEEKLTDYLGVYIGNPHTDSNVTAATVTELYHQAYGVIKKHVNASSDDVLIPSGFGMTEAVNKLQRILGLRINNTNYYKPNVSGDDRPVVFVTKQEHHSNHTSWLTTVAEVVLVDFDEHLQVDANHLESLLKKYNSRKLKIGSFSFSRGNHIIKVWTYNPNGLPDDDNSNDTVTKTVYSISLDIGIANIIKPITKYLNFIKNSTIFV
jgi:selenocysteine lyase/cysteine desulfurase